jgi:hypothetical protein
MRQVVYRLVHFICRVTSEGQEPGVLPSGQRINPDKRKARALKKAWNNMPRNKRSVDGARQAFLHACIAQRNQNAN